MIYLKKINLEDEKKEYEAIKSIPENENGLENKYYNVDRNMFKNIIIPTLINNSNGKELLDGYVPNTYFFLWDNNEIVGLFKIRHYLNDNLKCGSGHIGYAILKKYRGKGYATEGLKLAIDKCKKIISEDEVYLSVNKNNPSSLKVQLKCGAYIVGETETQYLTRIKFDNNIHFGYRDLKRNDWKRLIKKETIVEDVHNDYFEGKVCLINMIEVASPLIVDSPVGKVTIADTNYKNLIFAPKSKNWWLTVMFNNNADIIESYFDITRVNNFEDNDNPFFVDMKLDVCIPNGKDPSIMDKDELNQVLDKGLISKNDYNNAYKTANEIVEQYLKNKKEYYEYISYYFNKLSNRLTSNQEKIN